MSWDSYIDNLLGHTGGHADKACIIGEYRVSNIGIDLIVHGKIQRVLHCGLEQTRIET